MPSFVIRALFAGLMLSCLAGCATRPPATDVEATKEFQENNDPYEPANRVGYAIDNGADTYVLAPVARAYRYAVPGVIRRPVHNFLTNLTTPAIFINDVVQTKPRRAGDTFMRFVINTTAGVGGLFPITTTISAPRWRFGACRKGRSCSCRCSGLPTRGMRRGTAWTSCSTR